MVFQSDVWVAAVAVAAAAATAAADGTRCGADLVLPPLLLSLLPLQHLLLSNLVVVDLVLLLPTLCTTISREVTVLRAACMTRVNCCSCDVKSERSSDAGGLAKSALQ